jgi:hypothetical protein
LKRIVEIVEFAPSERRAMLIARVAFLNRLCETKTPALLCEMEFAHDAGAFLILSAFRPATFVTALYLTLLGRAPQEEEIASQTAALAETRPTDMALAVARSAEFESRSLPRQAVESIGALAAAMNEFAAFDAAQWPLLPLDHEVGPAELGPLLAEGWHTVEIEGAWTRAATARLCFKLDDAADRVNALGFDVRAITPPDGAPQSLTASLNGGGVHHAPVLNGDRFQFEIPLADAHEPIITVSLSVDRVVRLADYDPNGDQRTLGLFLYGLRALRAPRV